MFVVNGIKQARKRVDDGNIKSRLRPSTRNSSGSKDVVTNTQKNVDKKQNSRKTNELNKNKNNSNNDASEFTELVQDTGKNKNEAKPKSIPRNCSLSELNGDVMNDINSMSREAFMDKHGRSQSERIFKQMVIVDGLQNGEQNDDNKIVVSKRQTKETMSKIVNMASAGDDSLSELKLESKDNNGTNKESIDGGKDEAESKCNRTIDDIIQNYSLLKSIERRHKEILDYKFSMDTIKETLKTFTSVLIDIKFEFSKQKNMMGIQIVGALEMSLNHLKQLLQQEPSAMTVSFILPLWNGLQQQLTMIIGLFSDIYNKKNKNDKDENKNDNANDNSTDNSDESCNKRQTVYEKLAQAIDKSKTDKNAAPKPASSDAKTEKIIDSVVSNATETQLKDRDTMNELLQNEINKNLTDDQLNSGIVCNFACLSRYNGDACIGWGPARGSDYFDSHKDRFAPYSNKQRGLSQSSSVTSENKKNTKNIKSDNDNNNNDDKKCNIVAVNSNGSLGNEQEQNKQHWECPNCTILNDYNRNVCSICNTARDNGKNDIGDKQSCEKNANDSQMKEKSQENNSNSNNNKSKNGLHDINMDHPKMENIALNGNNSNSNGNENSNSGSWCCKVCTFMNNGMLEVCEMCDTPKNRKNDDIQLTDDADIANNGDDLKTQEISDDEYGESISKYTSTKQKTDDNETQSKEKTPKRKSKSKTDGSLTVTIDDHREIVTINGKMITLAEIVKDYKILTNKITRKDVVKKRNKDHDNNVLKPNKSYTNAEMLFIYIKLCEFEEAMSKQDMLFKNGKISCDQFDKISKIINIGRSGKSLQIHFNTFCSVKFKESVIGKLFCNLRGRIGCNTDSPSKTTS